MVGFPHLPSVHGCAHADESDRTKQNYTASRVTLNFLTDKLYHMTEQERLKVLQGVIDRLLYLNDADREEFLKYVDALFSIYKPQRQTKWGHEVFSENQNQEDNENRQDSL